MFRRTQDTFKRERSFDYGVVTSTTDLSRSLRLPRSFVTPYRMSLQPQEASLLVWAMFRFARRYSGNRICFLFLQVLRCFSSWVCLPYPMYSDKDTIPLRMVVSHSEIFGSKLTYSSPKHIGVSPVLHRLLVSRHPPCALSNLTKLKIKKYELHCYLVFKEHTFIYER